MSDTIDNIISKIKTATVLAISATALAGCLHYEKPTHHHVSRHIAIGQATTRVWALVVDHKNPVGVCQEEDCQPVPTPGNKRPAVRPALVQ